MVKEKARAEADKRKAAVMALQRLDSVTVKRVTTKLQPTSTTKVCDIKVEPVSLPSLPESHSTILIVS